VSDDDALAIRPYDFRRPYKSLGKQSAALEALHAAFAAGLSASLTEHLRVDVVISLEFVEQLRYDDFLHSLGEISCLSVLRVDPPNAQVCLDLSLLVIYPMIDRLLGGGTQPQGVTDPPHRPLTQIEQGLALQIVERAARQLADNWGVAAPLAVAEESLESAPATVRLMPGEEVVSAARFEVRVGANGAGSGGWMSLCVPAPVSAYLQDANAAIPVPRSLDEREAAKTRLTRNILDAAVELRALLAETKLRLSDVLSLQAGDVITTDKSANAEVDVQVQGKDKFNGRLGQLDGVRAVEIRQPVDPKPDSSAEAGQ